MNQVGSLPNLIVIGAMKCGTTSLHDYLNQHPDIFMSEKKEIDFFVKERNWDKGIEWYKENFKTDANIRGESSQDYSKFHWWEGVPARIHETLGKNVKFIYIIRDPLKRIYSHYREMQYQNCAPKDLFKYIFPDYKKNEIVLTSCYGKQFEKFLEFYSKEDFFITSLEKLKANKKEVLNEICSFLGIKDFPDSIDLNYSKNVSTEKRKNNLFGNLIKNKLISKSIKHLIPRSFRKYFSTNPLIDKVTTTSIQDAHLPEESEEKLKEFFFEDLSYLQKISGIEYRKLQIDYP